MTVEKKYTKKDSKYWKTANSKRHSLEKPFPYRFEDIEQRKTFKIFSINKGNSMNDLITAALKKVYPSIFK